MKCSHGSRCYIPLCKADHYFIFSIDIKLLVFINLVKQCCRCICIPENVDYVDVLTAQIKKQMRQNMKKDENNVYFLDTDT